MFNGFVTPKVAAKLEFLFLKSIGYLNILGRSVLSRATKCDQIHSKGFN
jgi:hypothetical protein